MKLAILFLSIVCSPILFAQFPGAAGTSNTNAIPKDSSIIVGWANHCTVDRGFLDISDKTLGLASYGQPMDATGPADGLSFLSLGDSGVATLSFPQGIFDGPGFDFAIFENSFNDSFLELGHVEVSSDGSHFVRFPSTFLQSSTFQFGTFDQNGDPEKINNLAGKYKVGYGTPFDLNELTGLLNLDVNNITHVRIVDVVGSISGNYASTDNLNNVINDPFPTPFASSGFDLDGVGVIHLRGVNSLTEHDLSKVRIYPNPARDYISITPNTSITEIALIDSFGKVILTTTEKTIDLQMLASGIYFVRLTDTDSNTDFHKLILR